MVVTSEAMHLLKVLALHLMGATCGPEIPLTPHNMSRPRSYQYPKRLALLFLAVPHNDLIVLVFVMLHY
jgi:hypothetical protein